MNNISNTTQSQYIDNLIDATTNKLKKDNDYIGNDGLLYCAKCNTVKQVRIEILGVTKTVLFPCKCESIRIDKEREEVKERERKEYIQKLKSQGITDKNYYKYNFFFDDQKDKKISNYCNKYIDNWENIKANNRGIIFCGGVGTGKTFYACCIGNALLEKGVKVLITNFAKILNEMQGFYDEEKKNFIDNLQYYELLIIDDLGIERSTDYALEQIYNVIDTRYRSGKPIIITTNLTPKELKNPDNLKIERVYDRVLEMCTPIIIDGVSRRKNVAEQKNKELSQILGMSV